MFDFGGTLLNNMSTIKAFAIVWNVIQMNSNFLVKLNVFTNKIGPMIITEVLILEYRKAITD